MIVSNRSYLFGLSKIGVIDTPIAKCAVSLGVEGRNTGHSITVLTFEGRWGLQKNQKMAAKAILNQGLSRKDRGILFSDFLNSLNYFLDNGRSLVETLEDMLRLLEQKLLVVEYVNSLSGLAPHHAATNLQELSSTPPESEKRDLNAPVNPWFAVLAGTQPAPPTPQGGDRLRGTENTSMPATAHAKPQAKTPEQIYDAAILSAAMKLRQQNRQP